MSIILRWGLPALVTVVGGTSLAISATAGAMSDDLAARTAEALAAPDYGWATVAFDARDAVITGTAADQQMIDAAVARVAAVHGVRSVRTNVVLAERVSPFPFSATVKDGAIMLAGGVPDETAHAEIVLATGAASDELRLLAGAPPRAAWRAAVDFGLEHLAQFDEGTVSLSDLDITIAGRAKSSAAFDALAMLETAPLPEGAALVKREIIPPLASPYEWRAEFDGTTVRVSGFVPSLAFAEALRAGGVGGYPVSTSLVLASGAPADFEAKAAMLLENLVQLEAGSADISDATATLTGAPADALVAESVRSRLESEGVRTRLDPPRLASYDFTARREGDRIVLGGHVPDEATRDRLAGLPGVDASGLALARGAPERFDSAVEFGLDILSHLSEGRFAVHNTALSIEGRAITAADFTAVETTLALGAPQGLILASSSIRPPLASPFTWSARKDADGSVRFAGYVPSSATRDALRQAVASLAEDAATLADGPPPGFEEQALAALGLLPMLDTAVIEYDGTHWLMSGAVGTPVAAVAVEQAFAKAGLRAAGWTLALDLPPAPEPVTLAVADPYAWSAQKASDGTITLDGVLPTPALQRVLVRRAGPGTIDNTKLAAGQPEGFIAGALAGIDALVALDEGTLAFDGRSWSLTGQVQTADDRLAVEAALRAATDTSGWTLAVQALDGVPVVSPYTWAATKTADGRVSLSGYVSTEELRQFIAVRAGEVAIDATEIASGEPAGFIGDVLAGLEALTHLATGTVKLDNGTWTLAGVPKTAADANLALAALATATAGGAGWQKQLDPPLAQPAPEPETAALEAAPDEPPAAEPERREEVANVPETEVSPAPPAAPAPRDFVFSASKSPGGAIELRGAVPADAARRFFGVIAGDVPTDGLTIADGLPADFIASADAGIRLLASIEAGAFGYDGSRYVFTATVETPAEREAALAALAELPAAKDWQTDIALLPPIDVCRRRLTEFASRNAIIFRSGSAAIAEESLPALDELAADLQICPDAAVNIEGHTDADGDEDANLALSVARAEAVVEALIARGVAFQRLYAVGYGESLPIADNDTAAGKRANRRIAFSFVDDGVAP